MIELKMKAFFYLGFAVFFILFAPEGRAHEAEIRLSDWTQISPLMKDFDRKKATSKTLFTLRRKNYKPEKTLHYDLIYSPESCEINQMKPLEVYYSTASGSLLRSREPISEMSKKYFEPVIFMKSVNDRTVDFTIKAFGESSLQISTDGVFRVELSLDAGAQCQVSTEIEVNGIFRKIKHIELFLRKIFVPVGVEWMRIDFHDSVKNSSSLCAFGGKCR